MNRTMVEGKICYMAQPIDKAQSSNGRAATMQRVRELLALHGFSVFDPARAWTNGIASIDRVMELDYAAIRGADALLAVWPPGESSIGIPKEINLAYEQEIPVVAVGGPEAFQSSTSIYWSWGHESEAIEDLARMVRHKSPVMRYRDRPPEREAPFSEAYAQIDEMQRRGGLTPLGAADLKAGLHQLEALDHPMRLQNLVRRVRQFQIDKGWVAPGFPRPLPELLMLVVSECAEALEEWRDGHDPTEVYYSRHKGSLLDKPEGVPIEIADVLIRLLGLVAEYEFDLESAMQLKLDYNDTRAHRHGGKLA